MTEYKTDFESATNATFGNYSAGVRSPMNLFDHTDAGTVYTYSQLLTGGNNSQVGAAKSFEVMPGDVFDAEVFAKYLDAAAGPANTMNTLFSALSAAFNFMVPSGSGLESVAAKNKFQAMYGTGSFIGTGDPENLGAPKAFINYILFDESFNLLDFGFDQVDASGAQTLTGPVVSHDQMALHIQVQKKGYLYIFISNESPNERSVYFDDMKIVRHTYVESVSDYYPFGLTFNSYEREASVDQRYKFQGQEHVDALDLSWDSFKWRNHQSDIGRFFGVDPLAEDYYYNSVYAFSENKVTSDVEIEGLESQSIHKNALNQYIKPVEQVLMHEIDLIKKLFELPKQKGKTEIEKKNEKPEAVPDAQRDQIPPTEGPLNMDGTLNPRYNKDGTANGSSKDKGEVMTQKGGQTKVTNPDNPGNVTLDSTIIGGYRLFKADSTSDIGERVKVGDDTINVFRKTINNIKKTTIKPSQQPGTIQKIKK